MVICIEIIGRLMDQEYPYGGQEDSRLGKEVSSISATLSAQLDEDGKKLLEEILDLEIQRTILVQEDAFEMGVCIGIRLMCEVQSHE